MRIVLIPSLVVLGLLAPAPTLAEAPHADVQKLLDKYRSALPASDDLSVYRLDWASTFDDAKQKAAREGRPILLIVVTNSYGNLHSGHC